MGTVGLVDVEAEGHGHDAEERRQAVQAHADDLVAVEGERPDVAIFLESLGVQESKNRARRGFLGERKVHAQQARRFVHAAHMVGQPEN